MPVKIGVQASVELVVSNLDTACSLQSGDVPVLATPRIISLCEAASVAALADQLQEGETSVSTRVELSHIAPVAVGSTVRAAAVLERNEGRRLVFNVSVNDSCGLVAAGRVTRVVVDREHFLEKSR